MLLCGAGTITKVPVYGKRLLAAISRGSTVFICIYFFVYLNLLNLTDDQTNIYNK